MPEKRIDTSLAAGRAVQLESFGGPEVLAIREIPAPQASAGHIRVRVRAAGLNPMDWFMTSDADTAARFGLSLPCGFGTDYAGIVDQIGDAVTDFAVGDRVFGGILSRSVADYVVIDTAGTIAAGGQAHHTPMGSMTAPQRPSRSQALRRPPHLPLSAPVQGTRCSSAALAAGSACSLSNSRASRARR